MKRGIAGLLSLSLIACAGTALAQTTKIDPGKSEFDGKCATCHGATGKGDGPLAAALKQKPADLTGLAKANNGVLPEVKLYETISGDKDVAAHGTKVMPAWGNTYRVQAGEYYVDMRYDPEAYVRARILVLIEYINRLQEK